MEKTGATSWLQIAANIGLIAGLALVAWQINQTSDLARDRLYHDRFDVWFAMQIATFGENASEVVARADYSPNDLTPADLNILSAFYGARLDYWRRIKKLGERGIIAEDDWKAAYDRTHPEFGASLLSDLSTPAGRAFWDTSYSKVADEEFVESIGNALLEVPVDPTVRYKNYHSKILEYSTERQNP